MIKVSIIVPIYNAEKYLSKCIDSILNQTERNIEVILVDDGSSDNSRQICREYQKKDNRVKIIYQENAGVSAARNQGIAVAKGSYIGFVDADDWIEPEMYSRLLEEAKKTGADIVMCDVKTVYDDGRVIVDTITQLSESRVVKKNDFTPSLLVEMAGAVWRCIYKTNKSNALLFPIGVTFSEDRIFNIHAMGYANIISYVKESYYNRYINKASVVHRFHADYFESYKKAAMEIDKAIEIAWNNEEKYKVAYLRQFINGALMAVCNYYYKTSTLSKVERKKAVEKVCEDIELRKAISKMDNNNIMERWILTKKISWLILYAKLANLKHGR